MKKIFERGISFLVEHLLLTLILTFVIGYFHLCYGLPILEVTTSFNTDLILAIIATLIGILYVGVSTIGLILYIASLE